MNRSQSVDVTLENNPTNPPTVPDRPAQKSRKSLHVSRSTRSNSDASELQLRPPNSSAITRWRHRPEVLVKGCCNYVAQVRICYQAALVHAMLSVLNPYLKSAWWYSSSFGRVRCKNYNGLHESVVTPFQLRIRFACIYM